MAHQPFSFRAFLPLCTATLCLGVTNIEPGSQFAWSENTGWLNWSDANGGADGVVVRATFLSGYVWSENSGWINVGNGRPGNGRSYTNADNQDFGVNINPVTGELFGLAWGENVGWINFDTRASLTAHGQQARLDLDANRFRGYAWGENIGWVNLDDSSAFVAYRPPICHSPFADADGDGDVDQNDFGLVQRCYGGANTPAPLDCVCFDRPLVQFPRGDNDVDSDDLEVFQSCVSGPAVPPPSNCGQ